MRVRLATNVTTMKDRKHVSSDHTKLWTNITGKHLRERIDNLGKKESHGIICKTGGIMHKLSNSHLSNLKLTDKLVSFVVKGRMQLLPCHSLLALYYPNSYEKKCKLCNNPYETVSHGCIETTILPVMIE